MIIEKVSFINEIVDIHYSVPAANGKEINLTLRSGDKPAPGFLNTMMKLRDSVADLLELPNTDEEIKRIVVKKVSFDYSSDDDAMGAVISATRELKLSGTKMALNTPHKFAKTEKKKKGAAIFDKHVTDLLETLQEEAIKYINGIRQNYDLFAGANFQQANEEVKPAEKKSRKTKEQIEEKPKFHINPQGPDEPKKEFAVKAKGKYLNISGNYALKLTALANDKGVLQDSIHEGMKEIGYAGNKMLFEVDGGLLQIHSAVIDYKQMNNDSLAKNAIEELIDDFVAQPTLRFLPGSGVDQTVAAHA